MNILPPGSNSPKNAPKDSGFDPGSSSGFGQSNFGEMVHPFISSAATPMHGQMQVLAQTNNTNQIVNPVSNNGKTLLRIRNVAKSAGKVGDEVKAINRALQQNAIDLRRQDGEAAVKHAAATARMLFDSEIALQARYNEIQRLRSELAQLKGEGPAIEAVANLVSTQNKNIAVIEDEIKSTRTIIEILEKMPVLSEELAPTPPPTEDSSARLNTHGGTHASYNPEKEGQKTTDEASEARSHEREEDKKAMANIENQTETYDQVVHRVQEIVRTIISNFIQTNQNKENDISKYINRIKDSLSIIRIIFTTLKEEFKSLHDSKREVGYNIENFYDDVLGKVITKNGQTKKINLKVKGTELEADSEVEPRSMRQGESLQSLYKFIQEAINVLTEIEESKQAVREKIINPTQSPGVTPDESGPRVWTNKDVMSLLRNSVASQRAQAEAEAQAQAQAETPLTSEALSPQELQTSNKNEARDLEEVKPDISDLDKKIRDSYYWTNKAGKLHLRGQEAKDKFAAGLDTGGDNKTSPQLNRDPASIEVDPEQVMSDLVNKYEETLEALDAVASRAGVTVSEIESARQVVSLKNNELRSYMKSHKFDLKDKDDKELTEKNIRILKAAKKKIVELEALNDTSYNDYLQKELNAKVEDSFIQTDDVDDTSTFIGPAPAAPSSSASTPPPPPTPPAPPTPVVDGDPEKKKDDILAAGRKNTIALVDELMTSADFINEDDLGFEALQVIDQIIEDLSVLYDDQKLKLPDYYSLDDYLNDVLGEVKKNNLGEEIDLVIFIKSTYGNVYHESIKKRSGSILTSAYELIEKSNLRFTTNLNTKTPAPAPSAIDAGSIDPNPKLDVELPVIKYGEFVIRYPEEYDNNTREAVTLIDHFQNLEFYVNEVYIKQLEEAQRDLAKITQANLDLDNFIFGQKDRKSFSFMDEVNMVGEEMLEKAKKISGKNANKIRQKIEETVRMFLGEYDEVKKTFVGGAILNIAQDQIKKLRASSVTNAVSKESVRIIEKGFEEIENLRLEITNALVNDISHTIFDRYQIIFRKISIRDVTLSQQERDRAGLDFSLLKNEFIKNINVYNKLYERLQRLTYNDGPDDKYDEWRYGIRDVEMEKINKLRNLEKSKYLEFLRLVYPGSTELRDLEADIKSREDRAIKRNSDETARIAKELWQESPYARLQKLVSEYEVSIETFQNSSLTGRARDMEYLRIKSQLDSSFREHPIDYKPVVSGLYADLLLAKDGKYIKDDLVAGGGGSDGGAGTPPMPPAAGDAGEAPKNGEGPVEFTIPEGKLDETTYLALLGQIDAMITAAKTKLILEQEPGNKRLLLIELVRVNDLFITLCSKSLTLINAKTNDDFANITDEGKKKKEVDKANSSIKKKNDESSKRVEDRKTVIRNKLETILNQVGGDIAEIVKKVDGMPFEEASVLLADITSVDTKSADHNKDFTKLKLQEFRSRLAKMSGDYKKKEGEDDEAYKARMSVESDKGKLDKDSYEVIKKAIDKLEKIVNPDAYMDKNIKLLDSLFYADYGIEITAGKHDKDNSDRVVVGMIDGERKVDKEFWKSKNSPNNPYSLTVLQSIKKRTKEVTERIEKRKKGVNAFTYDLLEDEKDQNQLFECKIALEKYVEKLRSDDITGLVARLKLADDLPSMEEDESVTKKREEVLQDFEKSGITKGIRARLLAEMYEDMGEIKGEGKFSVDDRIKKIDQVMAMTADGVWQKLKSKIWSREGAVVAVAAASAISAIAVVQNGTENNQAVVAPVAVAAQASAPIAAKAPVAPASVVPPAPKAPDIAPAPTPPQTSASSPASKPQVIDSRVAEINKKTLLDYGVKAPSNTLLFEGLEISNRINKASENANEIVHNVGGLKDANGNNMKFKNPYDGLLALLKDLEIKGVKEKDMHQRASEIIKTKQSIYEYDASKKILSAKSNLVKKFGDLVTNIFTGPELGRSNKLLV